MTDVARCCSCCSKLHYHFRKSHRLNNFYCVHPKRGRIDRLSSKKVDPKKFDLISYRENTPRGYSTTYADSVYIPEDESCCPGARSQMPAAPTNNRPTTPVHPRPRTVSSPAVYQQPVRPIIRRTSSVHF